MLLPRLLPLLFAFFHTALSETEVVWSSVVVTRFGDRVPLLSPDYSVLTPVGAEQLWNAGQLFRNRYIAPANGSLVINGISTYAIDNTQTFVMTLYDVFVAQSATAFMQGLYPPLSNSDPTNQAFQTTMSTLADGSNIEAPLGNYQYPDVYTAYEYDPTYIYLMGNRGCPSWDLANNDFINSPAVQAITNETLAFYDTFLDTVFADEPIAGGAITKENLSYANAYELWDYISYGYIHNSTINSRVSADDLAQARYLADSLTYGVNGNTSSQNFGSISGRTLAYQILYDLLNNVGSAGSQAKINLFFTSYEPMVALFSLLGLPDVSTDFTGMPELGASMAFELFSSTNSSDITYPAQSDLNVRFLFRNGTNTTDLQPYPIFGNNQSALTMPFNDFTTAMQNILLADVGVWCSICGSTDGFCTGYETPISNPGSSSGSSSSSKAQPTVQKPFVAGIIGAIIALALCAIALALAIFLFGVRFMRQGTRRRSDLGGFKGAEKLQSDVDLTSSKGVVGASVIGASVVGKEGGHRRVESWELREGRGRPSFEGDVINREGVKVAEGV